MGQPQEFSDDQNEKSSILEGEKVVISGMSGLYPQSNSVKELSDLLYNKKNPVTDENPRWEFQHPEAIGFTGKVQNLERFDARFFKVHYRLANSMDSMGRKVLEQAYQAIYDAGLSPEHLSGKKVGVYVGTCFSETEKACFYVASSRTGFGVAGCSKTMFANRISYWLNAKGPSLAIDEACCSSIAALEQAYLAITRGDCEAAIVGGANLCLHPQSSVHYSRIMQMCKDGKTKSFDQNADGCAKSEAINVLFLQKAKNALRIYAEVLHVKSEYTSILEGETGPRYGFYRDPMKTANFLKKFYSDARISPNDVEYVEAFGSAVPEADKSELEAIDHVFCKNRYLPLPIGSVMSNIGYGEAASGISAVTKVLLGYETGLLAGNLHLTTPRQDVCAMRDGRIEVITDHHRFQRTYIGVNALSITGINAHVLLHGQYKPKDLNRYKSSIPRLVTISGRQESAVQKIIDDLKSHPIDPEELALLYNIHETKISGHMGRGFVVLDTKDQKTESLTECVEYFDDNKRPLWFVYSGMGSQWPGMGEQLMRIPIFAAAIERCHQALAPKGINLLEIIISRDKTIFDNILHSFVGIAAVQIGLTDILGELGLVPDKIIGHSVGELGCAYADGCLTAEEMILAAYSRGLVSIQTPLIRGSMAAVGLGYQQIKNYCPPEIDIACRNGPQSSTISGPEKEMKSFVADLSAKGIFAKEVPCSNISYHSRYIADAGPGLLKYMKEVIKEPKLRSEKWLSTSVPKEKWNESSAMYCSAEYLTNNLLNPVLFEEITALIPSNAVLVEIAPHGLLQAVLKRSLHPDCRNIGLTRRGHPDNAYLVLNAIGQLYVEGYIPKIKELYPKVEFPVSTGTPMLSHQVEWAHNEKWGLPLYVSAHRVKAASCKFVISIHDEEHKYLRGHVVRGKILYPFSAVLVSVWDTLSMTMKVPKRQTAVQFSNIHFYAQPVLHDQRQLRLSVSIQRGTGRFEVLDENSKVATGFVVIKELKLHNDCSSNEVLNLVAEDIYQLLEIRDYSYSDDFKNIHSANTTLSEAFLEWNDNWVTFIDGMLQLNALRQNHNGVTQPKHIRSLYIHKNNHLKFANSIDGKTLMRAEVSDVFDNTRCGGVLIENIKFHDLPAMSSEKLTLKNLKFIPRFCSNLDVVTALHVYLQIVAENVNKDVINVVGITNKTYGLEISKKIQSLDYIPGFVIKYHDVSLDNILHNRDQLLTEIDLIVVQNLSTDDNICQTLDRVLQQGTFVLNDDGPVEIKNRRSSELYRQVCAAGNLQLLRWRPTNNAIGTAITIRTNSDLAMLSATRTRLQPGTRMVVFAPHPSPPGLIDLVRRWRKESISNQINIVLANLNTADKYSDIEADLAYNTWNDGLWGGEYFVPWQESQDIKQRTSLQSSTMGDLSSLQWVATPELIGPGVKVTVHYAGINRRDILKATGAVTFKDDNFPDGYGMDFSGVTESGERVMGIVVNGACSSQVVAQPELLWPVPDHWSLEDAATVPLAYMHAFYCLANQSIGYRIIRVEKNITLLVHGGAGSLGQAIISVALEFGCQVFTTVSNVQKKRFLLKLFPQLKGEHIGNSRDAAFGDMILSATNGVGCDMIISCVKGNLKNISLNCCSFSGVTLDTTVLSQRENYMFGLTHLTKERSYIPIDLMSIFKNKKYDEIKELHTMVSEGIAAGYVRPLSRVTYEPNDTVRAFRLMAASQHRGKVLLRLGESIPHVQHRFDCKKDYCNLLICDQGALGLQLAERLISRGAKKLHLHYNEPPSYLRYKIKTWRNLDVDVNLSCADLRDDRNVFSLIHSAMHLGPLEGLYFIAMNKNNEYDQELFHNLDKISRKLCSTLRQFTIISLHDNVGLDTCLSRAQDNYPSMKLNLEDLRMQSDNDNKAEVSATYARGIIDVVESAVNSNNLVLAVKRQPECHLPLIEQIAAVAEVRIQEEHFESKLIELGIDNEKAQRVSVFLRNNHNISYDEEYVQSLSVKEVNELEKVLTETNYKNVKGLETFFSYVDPDELLATTEMVFVSTLANSATMRDDEFDVSQTYLCIIPGFEGHYQRFSILSERIKLHTLVLQPGLDKPNETIQELAERYTQILLKRPGLKNTFYLLGYESGVLVALEVAANLEKQGLKGTVFCVGSDPDDFKIVLDEQLKDFGTDKELQDAVIRHMFNLMGGGDARSLEEILPNASSWNEKIDLCLRTLLGRVSHSAQYARGLIEAAFARIKQARCYNADVKPLRSKLVMLRSASNPSSSSTALSMRSLQPVAFHNLAAPLPYTTEDLRCAAIINKHLHEDILQAFENKNLCETYLLNADTFMMSSNNIE